MTNALPWAYMSFVDPTSALARTKATSSLVIYTCAVCPTCEMKNNKQHEGISYKIKTTLKTLSPTHIKQIKQQRTPFLNSFFKHGVCKKNVVRGDFSDMNETGYIFIMDEAGNLLYNCTLLPVIYIVR